MKKRSRPILLCLPFMMLFLMDLSLVEQAPTDAQVKELRESLMAIKSGDLTKGKKQAKYEDVLNKTAKKFDFSKLSYAQIKDMLAKGGLLYDVNQLRWKVAPALTRLARQEGLEGAKVGSMRTVYFPQSDGTKQEKYQQQLAWTECYKEFIHHPAIDQLLTLNDRQSSSVFGRLQFIDKKAVGKSGLIQQMMPLLSKPMSAEAAGSLFIVFKVAANDQTNLPKELVQTVRRECIKGMQAAMKKAPDNRYAKYMPHRIAYLQGPAARGVLIGNTAPEMDISWISEGKAKRLKDFKGKVVILDFWATWCSPCIGSFPNMRKLVERYKDYPVEFMGMTSLQGYSVDPRTKKSIKTKGKPDKEYELMSAFMHAMDMTWTVAFTEQDVFNEQLGVTGIPHVAIIDPSGVVRYNELRPYEAPYHEAEKIDALLKASGLPYPKQDMIKKNFSDVE